MNYWLRQYKRKNRRGVAPLEVVMILPLLVLFFVFIFYLASNARQHVEHLFSCRNDVWSQRYTSAAPPSTPYLFPANNAQIASEYISQESTKIIKTGTWFDKHASQKESFAHAYVLTGKTWDYQVVESNSLPNYYKKPFINIPTNLQSLGFVKLPGHDELFDMLTVEVVRQYLNNLTDVDSDQILNNIIKAGGEAFLNKILDAGKNLLLDQFQRLSGDLLVDRMLEIGGQEFLDRLIDAGIDVLCENIADYLMRRFAMSESYSLYQQVVQSIITIRDLGITVTLPTRAKLIDALKKVSKDRILAYAKKLGFDTAVSKLVDLGKKILAFDLKAEGQKLLQNMKKWGKDALKEILNSGLKKLVDLVKQCRNPAQILKLLKEWAGEKILSEAKAFGNKTLNSLGVMDTLNMLTDIFDQFKNIANNIKNFFNNFSIDQLVDELVSVVKSIIQEAAMGAISNFGVSIDLGKLNLDFKFEFKFDGQGLQYNGTFKPSWTP
jgi:hypothetical protein